MSVMLSKLEYITPLRHLSGRLEGSRETILARYDEKLREFLDFVLFQYVGQGVDELEPEKLPALIELNYHSVADAAAELGAFGRSGGRFWSFSGISMSHASDMSVS